MYQVTVWNQAVAGTVFSCPTLNSAVNMADTLRDTYPDVSTIEVTDPRNVKCDDSVRCYYSA